VFRFISEGTVEEIIYHRQIYKQKQQSVALEGSHETRLYDGVMGVKGEEGELWGLPNPLPTPNPTQPPLLSLSHTYTRWDL
jgi:hypothetical protein